MPSAGPCEVKRFTEKKNRGKITVEREKGGGENGRSGYGEKAAGDGKNHPLQIDDAPISDRGGALGA